MSVLQCADGNQWSMAALCQLGDQMFYKSLGSWFNQLYCFANSSTVHRHSATAPVQPEQITNVEFVCHGFSGAPVTKSPSVPLHLASCWQPRRTQHSCQHGDRATPINRDLWPHPERVRVGSTLHKIMSSSSRPKYEWIVSDLRNIKSGLKLFLNVISYGCTGNEVRCPQ